ncbi:DUF3159 domain-containing protein [Amycolatopsis solani]|uniref:DUF3159 domain-containing protein n=1 Tax=Amycolatopsis solani TaxID=3028615 RepID=UPI0025B133A9|nr:DUF3159 domain-containing protein [Amycolatopsis sp. MEP2-6]
MNFAVLTEKSRSVFTAIGGWRTVAEGVASRLLFLVGYLSTGHVLVSALVAVAGVLVFAVVRVCTERKWWQAGVGLAVVGLSAALAGGTGHGADFYLPDIVRGAVAGAVFLLSMLVRLPLVGVLVEVARGERFAWRRDGARRRCYQLCTALLLAKSVLATAVMVPFYAAGEVVPLGIASTVLGAPAMGLCVYWVWRILRARGVLPAAGVGTRRRQP